MESVIQRWTRRLTVESANAVAVVLKGSHVTGTAGPHSDIDFDVLVSDGGPDDHRVWLEATGDGRYRHISAAGQYVDVWFAKEREPEPWAFGLPVREPARLLWASTPGLKERLSSGYRAHPPAKPEIEDAIESLGKMRNAFQRGDELGLRQAAQTLAHYIPTILRPLNPEVIATSPRTAIQAVLAFPLAPDGYRDDMLLLLGMTPYATSAGELLESGARLVSGTISLAAEHEGTIAPLLADDLATYLRDGTLKRYVRQLADDR